MSMPHPVFAAHVRHIDRIKAERLLDAAQAATAQFQKQAWWDRLFAQARGMAHEIAERVGPMFTFNAQPINSSDGLRRAFGAHVDTKVGS